MSFPELGRNKTLSGNERPWGFRANQSGLWVGSCLMVHARTATATKSLVQAVGGQENNSAHLSRMPSRSGICGEEVLRSSSLGDTPASNRPGMGQIPVGPIPVRRRGSSRLGARTSPFSAKKIEPGEIPFLARDGKMSRRIRNGRRKGRVVFSETREIGLQRGCGDLQELPGGQGRDAVLPSRRFLTTRRHFMDGDRHPAIADGLFRGFTGVR